MKTKKRQDKKAKPQSTKQGVTAGQGEAAAGIVYATDAAISTRLEIIGELPADVTPAIAYALALTRKVSSPAAGQFYEFLRGAEARLSFKQHGFLAPAFGH